MKVHELKIWPQFFEDVLSGAKKYEVRINDRDYKRGDRLLLHEWNPETKEFTGRFCEAGVVHITYGTELNKVLPGFICVMGIEVLA